MLELTWFFWIGIVNLFKLVWSDLDTLQIDQRPSWLMNGVVLTLFWISGRVLELLFLAFIVLVALSWLKKYSSLVGLAEGDVTVFAWLLPGMFLLSYNLLIVFIAFYVLNLWLFSKFTTKNKGLPATFPMAIAFCMSWAIYSIGLIL